MKSFIIILSLFLSFSAYSQVGINTVTPQATLHTVGNLQLTKELSVGGTSNTYGNVGNPNNILVSNGAGVAPEWKKVQDIQIIPLITGLGIKTNVLSPTPYGGASYTAGSITTVLFTTTPKINSAFLIYNAVTGEYTVNKSGFYKIIGFLFYDLEDNDDVFTPPSDYHTAGTALTELLKNNTTIIAATSTYHHDISTRIRHTVSGSAFFKVGDKITLTGQHTQKYKFGISTLSIMYTGN